MSSSRRVHWAAAAVSALTGAVWSVVALFATSTQTVALPTGIVAGLAAGAALFLACAEGSSGAGALLASPTAAALTVKPFFVPITYTYAGKTSTFSPTSETHLYFLGPGIVLGFAAVSMLLVPSRGLDPSKRELRNGLRIVGGLVGLAAAAGLVLSFFDGRSALSNVVTGLGAGGAVGVLSVAAMLRGEPEVAPVWGAMLSPYGAPNPVFAQPYGSHASAAAGGETNELLRALAHAPAPPIHALPSELVELAPGARLGNFLIHSKLGAGGMGVVYRARDERLGREVALKLLPPHLAADPARRARFFREAKMAANVSSPNVATVYELGEASPPYIAMELVLGETLRARLGRGFVGVAEAHRIALAIASGLAAAHDRGVIHRDLKPENVMVAADGTTKLVDFGLARAASAEERSTVSAAHTRAGLILGTPRYMAPEQAAGGEVDARADVYAFGLVLVDLATGVGLDPSTPAVRRAEAAAAALATTLPGLAPIAARCLAFSPEGRYADGRELASACATASPLPPEGRP